MGQCIVEGLAWELHGLSQCICSSLGLSKGLTSSRQWPVLEQPQTQLRRDSRSAQGTTHVCILTGPASSPTGQQQLNGGSWQRLSLSPYSGSRGPHSSLYLNPASDYTPHDHQTKGREWDYKGYDWPLAPTPQLS